MNQFVGKQPCPRIADLKLDLLGTAGNVRLFAQRSELAADFPGQVRQPGQVGLHRLQLADCFLLAPPVLQDACCFFDEPAPVFRRGVQHLVELSLPHNDVHFTAQPGIGEQLLNVQ